MKYIIELKDDVQVVQKVGVTENGNAFVMNFYKDQLEELNSDYINEHFGELQDEAYQAGMDKAWEATKKIFGYEIDGAIPIADIGNVFGYEPRKAFCTADILRDFTAPEVIAKLKAYEEKHSDRIEVGDEVRFLPNDRKGIVTACHVPDVYAENDKYAVFCGTTVEYVLRQHITKTGKHYDIASILEAMRE